MNPKKTLFIINPISGTRDKSKIVEQIKREVSPSHFDYHIKFTKGPSHATDLAIEAAENKLELVVAVGGDGTVNETACGLVHTNTTLGIIPIGSGNGLGRHLQIPTSPLKAIRSLHESTVTRIDVCTANDIPFFNVAGVGYDARVAHDFAQKPGRGFLTYVQSVLQQWHRYKPKKYRLETPTGSFKKRALLISFANGSQFGNNAFIAPNASISDGLMDVSILDKFPGFAVPMVAMQLFSKNIEDSRYSDIFRTNEVTIKQKSKKVHLDGEPFKLGKKIHFKVLPGALNILAPKVFEDGFNT
ncbi:MAG: diacylglycerol/lipid kinase family protein [Owenweeksia sp.]